MRLAKSAAGVLLVLLIGGVNPASEQGERHDIDTSRSSLKVRVFKAGLFSLAGHDHEIEAPLENGAIEIKPKPSVQLRLDARKLRVVDPELAADKRAEVQETMLGPKVLDSSRFPEISFQSTAVEKAGPDHWTVRADLKLHGQTNSVVVNVTLNHGRYVGTATIKQRAFGIEPVSAGGGTVKVKDELRIEFDIVFK